MISKLFFVPLAILALAVSTPLLAKGKPQDKGPDARWINSNKQSDDFSTRGRERAEERHELKKQKEYSKKYKEKKQKYHKDAKRRGKEFDDREERYERRYDERRKHYNDEQDRYRRQYEEERNGMDRREYRRYDERTYQQQNPVDTIIDRNVNDAKSVVDEMHRRAIEGIDNKTREFTGTDSNRR